MNAGATLASLGSVRDFTGFSVNSSVPVKITMTTEEYGKGLLNVTGASGISSITVFAPDGTTVVTTLTPENGAATYNRGTVLVSGKACWCDYEMNGDLNNTGVDSVGLNYNGSDENNSFYNSSMLYTYTHPWRDISYPSTWTAVVRCTVPNVPNGAVITFGTCSGGLIGLLAGDNPETQMQLVKTTGNSAYTKLADMDIVNGTSAQHVYVFVVENNSTVKVYCDGSEVLNETYSAFTLGGGIQVGSVHGGINATGITAVWKGNTYEGLTEDDLKEARIDCVRLYDYSLSAAQIAALSVEFPAIVVYRATAAADTDTTWTGGTLDWSPAWTGGNDQSKVILTTEGDARISLPETITANQLQLPLATDSTLTLTGPGSITVTEPVDVTGGTLELTGTMTLTQETTLNGKISFAGFTNDGSGALKISSGSTVGVASGSVIVTPLGSYTCAQGTVVDSAYTDTGVKLIPYASAKASVTQNGVTLYYSSVESAFSALMASTDEAVVFTLLAGDVDAETATTLQGMNYYVSGNTVTKAVAKIGTTTYGTLAAAIAAATGEYDVELLRNSSETITLNKAITLSETGIFSGTLTGNGTLTFKTFRNNPSITFTDWTGTVVLPSFAADGTILNKYGVTGSTVVLKGITSGWLGETDTTNHRMDVLPALQLDGNVTITGFSTLWTYTFAEITGSGTFSLDPYDNHPYAASITKVAEGFSGSIYSDINTTLTIGTLAREAGTSTAQGAKLLSVTGDGDVEASALTIGGESSDVGLITKDDGIYVVTYVTITIPEVTGAVATAVVGETPVEIVNGEGSVREDATVVTVTYVAAAGWELVGQAEYTINVANNETTFTLDESTVATQYVASVPVNDVPTSFTTLAGAIAAASSDAENPSTVTLLTDCSEAVTLDKTIVFVENGFAFSGTLTGAGTIIVETAPSATTWAAARFVANGWTGTFVVGWDMSGKMMPDKYGITGSTVEVSTEVTSGYFNTDSSGLAAPSIAPALYFDKDVTINDGFGGSSGATTFAKVGMAANKTFSTRGNNTSGRDSYYTFTELNGFDGTLSVRANDHVTIGAVKTVGMPAANTVIVACTKTTGEILNSDGNDASVYPVDVTASVEFGNQTYEFSGKAVFATINNVSGLYYAVANIGDKYYATYDAAVADYTAGDTIVVSDATAGNVPTGWELTSNDTRLTKIQVPITWDVDGVQSVTYVDYGETPSYTSTSETPTRTATAQYTYAFTGWTPAFDAVTEATTYTAQFSSTVNQYTLTVPEVENATATVTVGDAEQTGVAGEGERVYTFDYGTAAVVTYTADTYYSVTANGTQNFTLTGNDEAVAPTVTRNTVTVTVPTVDNATVSVAYTTGGVSQTGTAADTYTVDQGTAVIVTYTAGEGYFFGNDTSKVVDLGTVTANIEVTAQDTGSTTAAVARDNNGAYYSSFNSALGYLYVQFNQLSNDGAYVDVIDGSDNGNAYADYKIGCDAAGAHYAKVVTKIGTAGYLNLADAWAAAGNGTDTATITVLSDPNDSVTVAVDQTLKVIAGAVDLSDNVYFAEGIKTSTTTEEGVTTYTARDWYSWTVTVVAENATVTGFTSPVSEASPAITFTVAAAETYKVTSVQVNGTEVGTTAGEYNATVTGNTTITVTTELDVVTFTVPALANATVTAVTGATPTGNANEYTATIGDAVTVTYTANDGYVFAGGATTTTVNWTAAAAAAPTAPASAPVVAVAKIGSTPYETLAAAIDAAQAGDTVTLVANETADANKTSTDDRLVVTKAITIDFGAYTYSVPGSLEPTANWCAIYIDADTTVTGTTGGVDCLDKAVADADGAVTGVYAFNVRNGATLTIAGGHYHGGGTIVQAQLGSVVVTGGTFTLTPYSAPYGSDFAFNCVDAAYQAGNAGFSIEGGTFVGFDPQDNKSEGAGTDYTAPGYIAVDDGNGTFTVEEGYVITFADYDGTVLETLRVKKGDTPAPTAAPTRADDVVEAATSTTVTSYAFDGWTVAAATEDVTYTATYTPTETVTNYVAQIGSTKYETLQEALDVGGEVTLLADIASTTYMYVGSGKTVSLDLNGKTITSPSYGIVVWGELTVDGGTITATYSPILVSGGTVTVEGGTYTSTGNSAFAFNNNSTGGTLTVNDATVQAQEFCVLTGYSSNNTITINGGEFTSIDNAVIGDNGTSGYSGNTFNITDGTFNGGITSAGYVACGIYVANNDTVNVSGGEFNITGGCGILARAGVVNVTGGTFTTTGSVTGKVGDSRVVVPCAAIVYDSAANYPGYDEATTGISLDNVTLSSEVTPVQVVKDEGDAVTVTATSDSIVVPADYKWVETETGYSLVEKVYVAEVNGQGYEALAEAIGAAEAGDTVTLLAGVTGPATIPAGKEITLDLNGKTISGGYYGIVNNGTLTVTGSGTVSGTYGVRAMSGSTTTIKSGTFNAQECAVATFKDCTGATINIDGGTFTTVDNSVLSGNGSANSGNNVWTINGGTFNGGITSAGYVACGIYAPNNDTWTVNGGTFNITGGVGILARAGVVTVKEGVTITTTGSAIGKVGDSNVVVPCAAIVYDSRAGYSGKTDESQVSVAGGTFTSAAGVDAVQFVNAASDTNQRLAVSGGTFSTAVAEEFCATGYICHDNGDGTYTVKVSSYVALIGEEGYETLAEAVEAADDGDTIQLLANVTLDAQIAVTKTLTLDMGGNTIKNVDDIWDTASSSWSLVSVQGGNLTITGNGKFDPKQYDCYALDVRDGGSLTIVNGTFIGNISAVYVYEGSVNVQGGSFDLYQTDNTKGYAFLINMLDSAYRSGTASAKITGGVFHNWDPQANTAESTDATTDFTPNGYIGQPADEEGWMKVVEGATVTWQAADGTVLATERLTKGTTPSRVAPGRDGWTFQKWTPAIEVVTNDVTYKAFYSYNDGVAVVTPTLPPAATEVTTIVTVPGAMKASALIVTEGRPTTESLVLKAFDKNTSRFYSWAFDATTDGWIAAATAVLDANGNQVNTTVPEAAIYQLTAGQGVWVTYDPTVELILSGAYTEEEETSALDTVDHGYNMVAPVPKAVEAEVVITDVVKVPEYEAETPAADKDIIVVPTAAAPTRVEVREGGWKTYKVWIDENGEMQSAWVDATIPAGTGFWYINKGNTKSIQK
ncbi:MAG: hypothetical protein II823_05710 [Kiritimatiellae bacterium]|nr:hypothetical protein [Kiritimatiellia bacterium]